MALENFIEALFGKDVAASGTKVLPRRPVVNFVGATVVDNPTTGQTDVTLTGGAGSGDVVGPASSTDNNVPRFDGTTGKVLQGSPVSISDAGVVSGLANPTVSSDAATKGYVDAQVSGVGGGDVSGPGSATDNAVARFDSTTGKIIQNSGVTISDTGVVSGVAAPSGGTDATNKTYVDNAISTAAAAVIPTGTDNRIVRYDGTEAVQQSALEIADTGVLNWVGVELALTRQGAALHGITTTATTLEHNVPSGGSHILNVDGAQILAVDATAADFGGIPAIFGASPAASGTIRFSANQAIVGKTTAGGVSVNELLLNASDVLVLGGNTTGLLGMSFQLPTGQSFTWDIAGTNEATLSAASLALGTNYLSQTEIDLRRGTATNHRIVSTSTTLDALLPSGGTWTVDIDGVDYVSVSETTINLGGPGSETMVLGEAGDDTDLFHWDDDGLKVPSALYLGLAASATSFTWSGGDVTATAQGSWEYALPSGDTFGVSINSASPGQWEVEEDSMALGAGIALKWRGSQTAHYSTAAGEYALYILVGHSSDPDGIYLRKPSDGAYTSLAAL